MPTPYDIAIQQALQRYPFLQRLGGPISLTAGAGPYQSESYMPKAEDNPAPGHYTVELRSVQEKQNPAGWPALLGREGLDWLARQNPQYQQWAQLFRAMMSQQQLSQAYRAYKRAQQNEGEKRTFDAWLKDAQTQE